MLDVYRIERQFTSYKFYLFLLTASLIGSSLSLLFFRIVGVTRVDHLNFLVSDLTVAVTCAVLTAGCVIASAAHYAHTIIPAYSGEGRVITYAWPFGRAPLFLVKNAIIWFGTFLATWIGMSVPLIPYALLTGAGFRLQALASMLIEAFGVAILSASISIISGLIGLLRSSGVAAIVAAIVLGSIAANSFANSGAKGWTIVIEIGTCLAFAITALCAIINKAHRITNEDVI
ncbi:export protein [Bifidobacterium olomucense]|uniref:Export protein n=1 Tax=Bifidobacterium olomucense TaxID=2675324 RepID=A0A7Y0EVF8_9BIFI|nr:export protein [Bifidobacterium sp. DSM 109959]NMM97160.1 export protein [Bifidobacterium sp. DSM 109959]